MTTKSRIHTLQTNPWHHEEVTQNSNSQIKLKANKVTKKNSLFPSDMIKKLETTQNNAQQN